jgi:hypothetical protein
MHIRFAFFTMKNGLAHPFCIFHDEKWPCLELSIDGRPWPDLKLYGWPWLAHRRGKMGGGRRGAAGRAAGCVEERWDAMGVEMHHKGGSVPACCVY